MTKLENALIWLYLKTWGKFGDHVIEEKDLWNFSGEDLETVIMGLAFPRKKEKTERVEALTDLIMEKFDQDGMAFREWAAKIHGELIEGLPKAVEMKQRSNSEEVSTSQQQQVLLIADELKQFDRKRITYEQHFARLSALATDFLSQFKSIQIHKWDPGKYYFKITLPYLVIKR